jgi:DNA-binding transcriptional regulator YiaG
MAKKDMEVEMEAMPVDNVGIMQGFLEMMNEDDDEFEEDDEYEAGEMLGRTPDSPEILMNNLRGDMRSIDARRDELADMVGYAAAAETPEPVLAMLQPVLAQQGIGAMMPPGPMPPGGISPVGAPNMPNVPNVPNVPNMPSDMMTPMQPMPAGGIGDMAPGAMPPGPPPLQMARGGVVQRFSQGTTGPTRTEDGGVSSVDESSLTAYSPEVQGAADKLLLNLFRQGSEKVPSLPTRGKELSEEYAGLLGSSKEGMKSQALFDLAGLGFSYAANIDPVTGKPMSGSPFARFAQAARAAPGILGKYAAEGRKEDRELKLLGLKGAQSEREAVLERNARLIEEKRKAAIEIAKNRDKSRFSKSDFGYEILTTPNLVSDWATGKTDMQQNMFVESAITDLLKPITEDIIDPKNNQIIGKRIKPGTMMPFVKDALSQWGDRQGMSYDQVIRLFTDPNARAQQKAATGPAAAQVPGVSTSPVAVDAREATKLTDAVTVEKGENVPIGEKFQQISSNLPGDKLVNRMLEQGLIKEPPKGLFWQFGKIAGPASGLANLISTIPGLGDPYSEVSMARTEAASAQEALVSAFIKSTNKNETEQRRVEERYRVLPDAFEDPYRLRNRMVAFDQEINASINELSASANNLSLSREQRRDADMRIQDLQSIRRKLNVPVVANTNKEVEALPEGTIFLWKGTQLNVRRGAR